MISTLTKTEVLQLINGPAGKLELLIDTTPAKKHAAWGIVCHPHPLYAGTMHNKIVTTLTRAFEGLGLNTIRFNFRGVGKSEGVYDNGEGELEDLLTVMAWLHQEHAQPDIWLAGFSFGAYIAAKAAAQTYPEKLVTVAPPVVNFPMQTIPPITCPWVLVQGEKDEVVTAAEVLAWAETRVPPPTILRFPEAGHFFHGQLVELRTRLEEALR